MSQDIDFIMPSLKTIVRPPDRVSKSLSHGSRSFQIQKSFVVDTVSQIHEQLRPEVNELKKFYKLKKQKQKREKLLIEENPTTNKPEHPQSQPTEKGTIDEEFRVDESGHLRDRDNNLVFIKSQKTQLKINQKKQLQKQTKQLSKKQRIKFHDKLSRNLLDRNLVLSGPKKRMRRTTMGLQMLEQGSYQPYSVSTPSHALVTDLNQAAKNGTETQVVRKRSKIRLQFSREVPNCEWWDTEIIDENKYLQLLQKQEQPNSTSSSQPINFENLLNINALLSEVSFQRVGDTSEKPQKYAIPLYLTKAQRKKLKRKIKKQKLIEKNNLIKLGLVSPDKPKLKISNMAIVMKNQFIIDPSKVEAEVKKQNEERLKIHLQTNSERKLTKSQKQQKALKKLKKDRAKQCRRIVFKLSRLSDPSHIFKVNMNAKQLSLNGFILTPKQYHNQAVMVMAEGGQKAIRFFKNLMLNRIKWNQKQDNRCQMIWEGEIQNSKIGKWRNIEVGDESETIRALSQRGVQNFRQCII